MSETKTIGSMTERQRLALSATLKVASGRGGCREPRDAQMAAATAG
jgi:hypothetical protein